MASDYTVGDLVAEFLTQCGVTTAFGIASVHNIPMLDAIGRRNAIRFVMARGELGGAHMADGYARVSGGLGVIFSSTGPGAANAIGGLIEARFSGTSVLHITGQTSTKFVDRELGTVHDAPDQLGMLRSVSKSAYRIRSAQQAIGVLTRAAVDALSPPTGPVSVEVPIDLQRTPVEVRRSSTTSSCRCRHHARLPMPNSTTSPHASSPRSVRCCGLVPARAVPVRRCTSCSISASPCSTASTARASFLKSIR
jgi:thiamine pyrophosphate-dependent acetolactate synthase large subunit-like protein